MTNATCDPIQMVYIACGSNDLMEKVDSTCDTSDLLQLGDTDSMSYDSLFCHEKKLVRKNKLMNTSFKDES